MLDPAPTLRRPSKVWNPDGKTPATRACAQGLRVNPKPKPYFVTYSKSYFKPYFVSNKKPYFKPYSESNPESNPESYHADRIVNIIRPRDCYFWQPWHQSGYYFIMFS